MKKKITLISLFATILLFSSCESVGPGAQRGVAAGAATGAILGGIIGHQSGEGGEGAALGAATGAVLGGLLGNASDKENATREAKAAYRAREDANNRRMQNVDASDPLAEVWKTPKCWKPANVRRLQKRKRPDCSRSKKMQSVAQISSRNSRNVNAVHRMKHADYAKDYRNLKKALTTDQRGQSKWLSPLI